MNETLYNYLVYGWIAVALLIFPVLRFVTAPYGRHSRKGWGPMIPNRIGWIIMELPALLVFLLFALSGEMQQSDIVFLFIFLWVVHYGNRSLIYPLRIKTTGKKMPLSVALMAIFFNLVNGFINGYYLGYIRPQYPDSWLTEPQMILGLGLFISGLWLNLHSDEKLLALRKGNSKGYQIPRGGMFEWISCPNFFGEMVEWLGFALMTWSIAGLSFFIWTAANLIPRALDHHQWYQRTFRDYPNNRKAVFPFIL